MAKIYDTIGEREKMKIGCEQSTIGEIGLIVNFKNVQFDAPKRIGERKVRGGTAFMFWRDKNFYSNDIFTLTVVGDTGNLFDPHKVADAEYAYPDKSKTVIAGATIQGSAAPKEKLQMFFQLLALSKEKNYQDDGKENLFYIIYNSATFREPIRFWGHFETGLTFSDDAEDPFHKEFNFNFKVYYSEPDLIDYFNLIKTGSTNTSK
jgi:hypothetical protein